MDRKCFPRVITHPSVPDSQHLQPSMDTFLYKSVVATAMLENYTKSGESIVFLDILYIGLLFVAFSSSSTFFHFVEKREGQCRRGR